MPTYVNSTNRPITISEGITSRVVQINETIESDFILDATTDLTPKAETPYYNPVIAVNKLTGAGVVQIDTLKTRLIKVISKADLDLHLNNSSNTPPMFLANGEIVEFNNSKQIYELHLSGPCVVIQMRDKFFN